MCRSSHCLATFAIALTCVVVVEAAYYSYQVFQHQNELSTTNLLITAFINFSTLFFAAVLIVGVFKSNEDLIIVWIIYGVIELSRSLFYVYAAWSDSTYDNLERLLNSCDAGLQVSTIISVLPIVIINKKNKTLRSNISTLGRSIELNKTQQILEK